ncbi:MAG TPA: TatD family hydrolase [Solirubrobacteraceae bacterium]|nr:TatD family hydrolase [Solirubrobacteraceae bacterium]
MIDSHTHLHICAPPDTELVTEAHAAGVTKMLTVGTDVSSSRVALEAAALYGGVFAAVGIHPNAAAGYDDAHHAALLELAADPLCRAVGETGLDFYREGAPREDQERAFRAQIEIARAVDKPLVIHTREADTATLAILEAETAGVKVILHCFSMPDRIEACLAHPDWWLSFAGNVTYPANAGLRAAAIRVPAERLLVETDAPYLTPVPKRGTPNAPARVRLTAEAVALERRVPYADFDAGVEAAAAAAFGW